jgi:hypothetical protein
MHFLVRLPLIVGICLGLSWSGAGCSRQSPAVPVAKEKSDIPETPHKPRFTISKETTYITEPLDKDGYPDYAAALNERLGKGVTPENNANVLIWKALGPKPEGGRGMPPGYFKLLGIEPPPERGEYFTQLDKYLREQSTATPGEQQETVRRLGQAVVSPWTADDFPQIGSWLKSNEKSLAILVDASKRSHYFNPLVSWKTNLSNTGLTSSLLPSVQACRGVASALACRAMRYLGEGNYDAAASDLLACHRLGRHIGLGGTLIEALAGNAIDGIASQAELAFIDRARINARQLRNYLSELQSLPPSPVIADKVETCERFMLLEYVTMVNRYGIRYMEAVAEKPATEPDPATAPLMQNINWDPAFRNVNRWYDRMKADLREPNALKRSDSLQRLEDDLKALKRDFNGFEEVAKAAQLGKDVPETMGRAIGDILITLLLPAIHKVQVAADRAEQTQRNLHIAFALAIYQRENGKYPEKLDALAPKYLAKVPDDLFTGKPLVYKPTEKGYQLYSLGPNGKVDAGRGREDDPASDDIAVRMPLPKPKGK